MRLFCIAFKWGKSRIICQHLIVSHGCVGLDLFLHSQNVFKQFFDWMLIILWIRMCLHAKKGLKIQRVDTSIDTWVCFTSTQIVVHCVTCEQRASAARVYFAICDQIKCTLIQCTPHSSLIRVRIYKHK